MENTYFIPVEPRNEDLAKLQHAMPECVRATVEITGVKGLQQFFDGYKTSADAALQAA